MTYRCLAGAMCVLSLVACASGPDQDALAFADPGPSAGADEDEDSADEPAVDAGAKDAGKATGSTSSAASTSDAGKASSSGSRTPASSASSSASKDAGAASASTGSGPSSRTDAGLAFNPLDALTDLLGGGAASGSKPASSSADGGVDHCGPDLFCFDIFDCAIFHPDALDCGFTKCEGFVCKK